MNPAMLLSRLYTSAEDTDPLGRQHREGRERWDEENTWCTASTLCPDCELAMHNWRASLPIRSGGHASVAFPEILIRF